MRILLYPWFGSTVKNWSKYSQTYKYLFGPNTVVDVVPYKITDAVFYKNWKKIQAGSMDHLVEKEYDCIHMMSGGCLIAYNQMDFNTPIISPKKIFDSGPFFPCPDLTSNYIYHQTKVFPRLAIKPVSFGIKSYWESVERFDYSGNAIKYEKWLNNHQESLCMISPDDVLLDMNRIDKFINKTDSIKIKFNSPHARLLEEKDKYCQSLLEYLS